KTDPFSINNVTQRIKAFRAIAEHEFGRNRLAVSGGYATENDLGDSGSQDVLSFNVDLSRRITMRTTVNAGFGLQDDKFGGGESERDHEYIATAGLRYSLSNRASAFFSYTLDFQNSNVNSSEFTEHSVIGGVRFEF